MTEYKTVVTQKGSVLRVPISESSVSPEAPSERESNLDLAIRQKMEERGYEQESSGAVRRTTKKPVIEVKSSSTEKAKTITSTEGQKITVSRAYILDHPELAAQIQSATGGSLKEPTYEITVSAPETEETAMDKFLKAKERAAAVPQQVQFERTGGYGFEYAGVSLIRAEEKAAAATSEPEIKGMTKPPAYSLGSLAEDVGITRGMKRTAEAFSSPVGVGISIATVGIAPAIYGGVSTLYSIGEKGYEYLTNPVETYSQSNVGKNVGYIYEPGISLEEKTKRYALFSGETLFNIALPAKVIGTYGAGVIGEAAAITGADVVINKALGREQSEKEIIDTLGSSLITVGVARGVSSMVGKTVGVESGVAKTAKFATTRREDIGLAGKISFSGLVGGAAGGAAFSVSKDISSGGIESVDIKRAQQTAAVGGILGAGFGAYSAYKMTKPPVTKISGKEGSYNIKNAYELKAGDLGKTQAQKLTGESEYWSTVSSRSGGVDNYISPKGGAYVEGEYSIYFKTSPVQATESKSITYLVGDTSPLTKSLKIQQPNVFDTAFTKKGALAQGTIIEPSNALKLDISRDYLSFENIHKGELSDYNLITPKSYTKFSPDWKGSAVTGEESGRISYVTEYAKYKFEIPTEPTSKSLMGGPGGGAKTGGPIYQYLDIEKISYFSTYDANLKTGNLGILSVEYNPSSTWEQRLYGTTSNGGSSFSASLFGGTETEMNDIPLMLRAPANKSSYSAKPEFDYGRTKNVPFTGMDFFKPGKDLLPKQQYKQDEDNIQILVGGTGEGNRERLGTKIDTEGKYGIGDAWSGEIPKINIGRIIGDTPPPPEPYTVEDIQDDTPPPRDYTPPPPPPPDIIVNKIIGGGLPPFLLSEGTRKAKKTKVKKTTAQLKSLLETLGGA